MDIAIQIKNSNNSSTSQYSVVDLFCGVGGLTHGFLEEKLNVVAGIDLDRSCRYAYTKNNGNAKFIGDDIKNISAGILEQLYPQGHKKILVGCAPCQPFSKHKNKIKDKENIDIPSTDERWRLLYEFLRLVKEVQPEIVSMENVPEVINHKVFNDFIEQLKEIGYHISDYSKPVYCPDYGVPQKRYRLVMLASKLGPIELIPATFTAANYPTVVEAIGELNPIASGEVDKLDPLHRARELKPINLKRIKSISEGQNWTNLSDELISPCHKTEVGKSFTGAYGRMRWNDQAPTMTTHCTGFSNGRFGHPIQDRAISLREAAIIQSFPKEYDFIEPNIKINVGDLARHIGNAVPPKLGKAIGISIINHIEKFESLKL